MFRSSFVGLVALALLAACSDGRDATSPRATQPALGISDGAHSSGNQDFFFLPPIAANPSNNPSFDVGRFNGKLKPTVSICMLDLAASACVAGDPIKAFGPADISLGDEQYHVNWDTKATPLQLSRMYRIAVFVGPERIGYVDVDPVSNGSQLRAVNTNEYIGLVDGKTLPIKFRIEQGVTCANRGDCAEQTVSNAGATVVTNTGFAGVRFPEGWIPIDQRTGKPYENVLVRIERVPVGADNRCHSDLNLLQFEGCYQFSTEPDVGLFAVPVRAGICPELSASDPLYSSLAFYKSGVGEVTAAAPEGDAPFLNCDGFTGTPITIGALGSLSRGFFAFAGGLGRFLSPKAAYAIDLGWGADLLEFSRGGWAVESDLTIVSGDGQSGAPGATLGTPLSVQVLGHHGRPVPGLPIQFTAGAGSVSATGPVLTNSSGIASTNWTLGAAGAQSVTASVAGLTGGPTVTFNGTAVASIVANGAISDPINDAGGGADLFGMTADVANGSVTFGVTYVYASIASITPLTTISVDTDQNPATGHPGIDAGGSDNALMSADFIINIENGQAQLFAYAGTPNSFSYLANASCTMADNAASGTRTYSCTFSLAQLGSDDGYLNFKATSATSLGNGSYTGVQDYITNIGTSPGTTSPVIY